jgi:hypothetical protein
MENKYKNIQISIAYDEDKNDIFIDDALKNNIYRCYDCNEILIVKHGKEIAKHYAHKSLNNCNGESWQHIFCKKIIGKYLKNLKFKSNCNTCNKKTIKTFKKHKTQEEYAYNNFKIDVGILDNDDNLDGCIEIFHTHKTEENKCKNIVFNQIKYFEIKTKELILKYDNIKQGKTTIYCENTELCLQCNNLEIKMKTLITNFMINYLDYFKEIYICKSIIEISNGLLYDKLKSKLNETINNDKMKDYEEHIITGSYMTWILKEVIDNIQKKQIKIHLNNKNKWDYNNINIFVYDENGIVKYNELINNKEKYNTIKTPNAKNIQTLLNSFDIPCSQIGYYKDKFYLTSKALYSLITDINIMKKKDDNINIEYMLEYVYDEKEIENNNKLIKDNNELNIFNRVNTYKYNGIEGKKTLEKYLLFTVDNFSESCTNSIQDFIKNLEISYNDEEERTFVKSKGGKFNGDNKKWYIPITQSLFKFKKILNSNDNYGFKIKKINNTIVNKNVIENIDEDIETINNPYYLLTFTNPLEIMAMIKYINENDYNKVIKKYSNLDSLMTFCGKDSYNTNKLENISNLFESKTLNHFHKTIHSNKLFRTFLNIINLKNRIDKYENRGFVFIFDDEENIIDERKNKKYYGCTKCNYCHEVLLSLKDKRYKYQNCYKCQKIIDRL